VRYLKEQLDRFQDTRLAAEAYYAGPGAVERSLRTHTAVNPDVSDYAARAIRTSGNINVGDVHINITNPKSAEEAHKGALDGMREALRRQTQYDLAMAGVQ
jgi:hypothetical protein